MAKDEEKMYLGNAKKHESKYGEFYAGAIDIELLYKGAEEGHSFTTKSGKVMVKVKLIEKKEPDQYGYTHVFIVDTWKPEEK